jgi:hypothetical protein
VLDAASRAAESAATTSTISWFTRLYSRSTQNLSAELAAADSVKRASNEARNAASSVVKLTVTTMIDI